ncbi:Uncharacterised protein [Serratia grimesii]|jgi:pilus assembly protein HofO|nr:Uncharacterised protein [Serratia grimesii]SMZ58884.1 Uncharacterised protein [Serratia grimesii]
MAYFHLRWSRNGTEMNKPLPRWMARWLGLSGRALLGIQGLMFSGMALLFGLLLQGKWQQLEQTAAEHQLLTQRIELLSEQVARMPTLEAVNQNLQQIAQRPATKGDLMTVLQRVGAGLQRWQQHEGSSQQMLRLHLNYGRLLILLENLPAQLRLAQMSVEAQAGGLTTDFTFQDAVSSEATAVNINE